MKFGDFELSVVRECAFKLDGGAMFGVVPKTLWNKLSPADELNRITMVCNLLLIKTPTAKILVETGMGNRWSDKERERYDLKTMVDSAEPLQSIGIAASEVDAVLLSHLHFDHAGGATVMKDGKLVPTFPNAKYYSQLGEWEFAHNANGRAKASYRPDDYEPLKSAGQLVLAEGDTEIAPGVWLKVTGGHTSHHQVIYFESQGNKGVFFADIIPTASHLTPPWVMGYDHFPLAVCDLKSEWLARAAKEGWLAVFDHEPESPWGRVIEEGGKFKFQPISEIESVFHSEARSAVAP